MSIKTKLDKLERKARPIPPAAYSGHAAEVRELDADIRRLRREIQESEAAMTPEELAQSRAEHEEFMKTLEGLELDEQIEALSASISATEAAIEAEKKGIR